MPLLLLVDEAELGEHGLRVFLGRRARRAGRIAADTSLDIAREGRRRETPIGVDALGIVGQGLLELIARERRAHHVVEKPIPSCRTGSPARKAPMAIPSRGGMFGVRVVAVVGEDEPPVFRQRVIRVAVGLFDHVARQGPMPDGCHHVLTDAKFGDGCLVSEGGAFHHAIFGLVERFLEPHLPQRKRLMASEMRHGSFSSIFSPHTRILLDDFDQ